jgi:hypothetical protein
MRIFCICILVLTANLASAFEQLIEPKTNRYVYEINFTEDTKKTGNVTEEDIPAMSKGYPPDLKTDDQKKVILNSALRYVDAVKEFSSKYIIPPRLFLEESPKKYKIILNLSRRSKFYAHRDGIIVVSVNFSDDRSRGLSKDGIMLILCHEAAHHDGLSVEGLADYAAISNCLANIYSPKETEIFIQQNNIPSDVVQICQRRFNQESELNLCFRLITVGIEVSEFFYDGELKFYSTRAITEDRLISKVELKNPDTSFYITSSGYALDSYHPTAQCRLDIMVRATLQMDPPPCLDGRSASADILKVEDEFDFIYGETNFRTKVCLSLLEEKHLYSESFIEARCDWGNCVRFMRKYARDKISDEQIDIHYLKTITAEVDRIHKNMEGNGKYSVLNLMAVADSPLLDIDINKVKKSTAVSEDVESFRTCKSKSGLIKN